MYQPAGTETGVRLSSDKIGQEIAFLLRQKRNFYHQLKSLDKRMDLELLDSPEELVRVLNGRRKLIEKLRLMNQKLKAVKANWKNIKNDIDHIGRMEIGRTAKLTYQLIRDIETNAGPKQQNRTLMKESALLVQVFMDIE